MKELQIKGKSEYSNLINKSTWTPLWHIYQPPNQSEYWLRRVAEESYEKIIEIYERHPKQKLVLNINGSLTQLLMEHKMFHIILGLRKLAERGQLEFVSTLAYHAIAPLIPEEEIIRQIKLNDQINRQAFGESYKPTGVWLPEMAYSKKVIKPITQLGYRWISLAGVASNGQWTNTGIKHVSDENGNELAVLFRDDRLSLNIAFGQTSSFMHELRNQTGKFCFTTMDGETIGHHQKQLIQVLDDWLTIMDSSKDMLTMRADEVVDAYPDEGIVDAFDSSWSTTYEDIIKGNHYPLWLEKHAEPYKTAHHKAWKHMYTLLAAANAVEKDAGSQNSMYLQARNLVDKCLYSCSYWWYTREDSHRAAPRFLASLDMQGKAMRMLLEISNTQQLHSLAEDNEQVREDIYELLNNEHYVTDEQVMMPELRG